MLSRTFLNIALFVVVTLLAVYIYISSQDEQAAIKNEQLTQLLAGDVSQITIQHNQRHIELVKQGDTWRMQQPIDIEANSFRIDTLLKLLDTVSHASYSVIDLDPEKYGLHDASTSIRFNDVTLDFGIINPINNYRYVRRGETVHLIDDHYYPLLSSQTGTLVAREMIAGDAMIEKLVLPEQTLYKDEKNRWRSSSDIEPDAISETLYQWKHGQAFGVHNYMQRDSLAEISVFLAGNTEAVRFYVTDIEPWLIIARPELDIEYHFNLEFYDRLLQPGAESELPGQLNE